MDKFYRITTYKAKEGAEAALISMADQMKSQLRLMVTAKDIEVIRIGENEFMTIATHASEASARKGAKLAQSIYSQMGDLIDVDTVETRSGPVIWSL